MKAVECEAATAGISAEEPSFGNQEPGAEPDAESKVVTGELNSCGPHCKNIFSRRPPTPWH